jgi:hypothetical protein
VVLVIVHLAAGRDSRLGLDRVVVLFYCQHPRGTMFRPWWWHDYRHPPQRSLESRTTATLPVAARAASSAACS